jgi:PLP dependent protein
MIEENLKKIEEQVNLSCLKSGRNRSEIRLIAVSKTQPVGIINEALNAGLRDLGENKAQELRDKSELIKGDFTWHFIGHLQANKIKYVIKNVEFIHAVDSKKLAEEINLKAVQVIKKQNVLLEIKTSDEDAKHGLVNEKDIFETADYCRESSNLNLVGLMTMAPYTDDERLIRQCFVNLRNMKDKMNSNGFNLKELSMGMTNDFTIAVEEGATMIRIGTAIFGSR